MKHRRILPPDDLAPFVAHYWSVEWDLDAPSAAETLPHPSVHVVFEAAGEVRRADVTFVHTARFRRQLSGRGWVFGIKFRPAAFQPLLGRRRSVGALANRVVPVATVFGADGGAWAREVLSARTFDRRMAVATSFLRPRLARLSPLDPEAARVRDLVERVERDRSLLRVEQLARAIGVDVRALQRVFRRLVGAPPKWVLQRYRLHEAAERLKAPHPPPLASIAAELGYADQAHFARDFRSVVGQSPGRFAGERR